MLMPVIVAVFFVAAAERGHPAAGKPGNGGAGTLVALADPLAFIAERSPGGREDVGLLTTKPERTAALENGPEERVLSSERDRAPGDGAAPAADNPVFGAAPGTAGGPLGDSSISGGGPGDEEPFVGGPLAGPPPAQPLLVPGGFAPLTAFVAAVPEPGTWAMLIIGFFAVGAGLRQRVRRQRA
jgi:hypothetical protein